MTLMMSPTQSSPSSRRRRIRKRVQLENYPLELEAHVTHKSLSTPLLVEYSDGTDG